MIDPAKTSRSIKVSKRRPRKALQASAGWSDFEEATRQCLEALGYSVTRDELIDGSQVDLVAYKDEKLVPHQLFVECKSSAYPIGVGEVRTFCALFKPGQNRDLPTYGLIVAKEGFTKEARDFAKLWGVKVTTLDALRLTTFSTDQIIEKTISWFENDRLSSTYVDLTCTVHEFGSGTVYKPVEKFFDSFFTSTRKQGVAVLGNFGSGKTSLCRHYAYLLATRWRAKQDGVLLPIYVNLRNLTDLCTIENDLIKILLSEYGQACTVPELRGWLELGKTLLLLDGFDELGARMSNADVHRSLEALARFTEGSNIKIILTCRTHFFRTRVEENTLKTAVRLYVKDWGAEELISYVNRAHTDTAKSTIATIRQTYNLEELAKTPIFLKMITETVADVKGSVNTGKLYQLYTDQWIESQEYRSRLSPLEVRLFMQELAQRLFVSGSPTIDHKELPKKIQESLNLRDRESVTKFDQDVRTCTFLVRDADGRYGYVHRSFMEFFLGFKLANEIKERDLSNFSFVEVSKEVAGFLSAFFESEPEVLVRMLMSDASDIARANCARSLGELSPTPRIENSLLLALDLDSSSLVKQRIIEALASSRSVQGVGRMLEFARADSQLGLLCLRELTEFYEEPNVRELLASILDESTSGERVKVALEAISTHRSHELLGSLARYVKRRDWAMQPSLVPPLLRAVQSVSNVELAVESIGLIEFASGDKAFDTVVRPVQADLSIRVRSAVEAMAKAGRDKGLSHSTNQAQLRRRFGPLLSDEHVRDSLAKLYGGPIVVKGRKPARKKG